jgi:cerevisin
LIVQTHFEWIQQHGGSNFNVNASENDLFTIGSFHGYAVDMDVDMVEALSRHEDVASIEREQVTSLAGELYAEDTFVPFQVQDNFAQSTGNDTTTLGSNVQNNAPWNLARLSTRSNSGQSRFVYDDSEGTDAMVFVVDTGVNSDHKDFDGRAFFGFNSVPNEDNKDNHGHGSHVAGTLCSHVYTTFSLRLCEGIVASKSWGVAKKAIIVSVKVMNRNGGGTESQLLAGLNWLV